MKKHFLNLLGIILTLVAIGASADPVHITIPSCREFGYTEFAPMEIRSLEYAVSAIKCGKPEMALGYIAQAQKLIARDIGPIGVTPRGSCFSGRGCTGYNIGTATVEKGTCDAAGGKSWRQETPTRGACVNI